MHYWRFFLKHHRKMASLGGAKIWRCSLWQVPIDTSVDRVELRLVAIPTWTKLWRYRQNRNLEKRVKRRSSSWKMGRWSFWRTLRIWSLTKRSLMKTIHLIWRSCRFLSSLQPLDEFTRHGKVQGQSRKPWLKKLKRRKRTQLSSFPRSSTVEGGISAEMWKACFNTFYCLHLVQPS